MERYFRYEAAGDQFLGRVVAGLPVNSEEFAVLPPYFANNDDATVVEMLQLTFPSVCHLGHLAGVLQFALASLVFHRDYLVATLPSTHALLHTPLFCSEVARESLGANLTRGTIIGFLRPTGIPPHVEIYKKMEKNHDSILSIPNLVLDGVAKILDERGAMAPHLTKDVLESCLAKALGGYVQSQPPSNSTTNARVSVRGGTVFEWGGQFRRLPEDFEFPSVNVSTAWRLWWLGNGNIFPFSKILPFDLSTRKKRDKLSEWKVLMTRLHDYTTSAGFIMARTPSEVDVLAAFEVAKQFLLPYASRSTANNKRPLGQLKVCTVVKLVRLVDGSRTQRAFKKRKTRGP
ncbi:hypothetical protein AaE_015287 [Aphanomyces astaci]|uniref:Uncharacterized protein n=1 Tax=Aphanomyces astaci TaxID=112090 RepID=A0A6A4Z2H1_APHAT|nr:hypothetical protein AaE_015287 [Aphanomyces astaci]